MNGNQLYTILLVVIVIFSTGCIWQKEEPSKKAIKESYIDQKEATYTQKDYIESMAKEIKEVEEYYTPITYISDRKNMSWTLNTLYRETNSHCYMIFIKTKDVKSMQPISYKYQYATVYSGRDATHGTPMYISDNYSNFSFVQYAQNATLYADLISSEKTNEFTLIKVFDKIPEPTTKEEREYSDYGNASFLGYGYWQPVSIEPNKKNRIAFAMFYEMPKNNSILRIEINC